MIIFLICNQMRYEIEIKENISKFEFHNIFCGDNKVVIIICSINCVLSVN